MTDDRAEGQTFALQDIGFLDFESKSAIDIKKAGAWRYAVEADAIVCSYAIGDQPTQVVAVKDFNSGPLQARDMPMDFMRHHGRVMDGKAIWAAWNAGFDKAIWNYSTVNFPELAAEHIIDVMAQATANGLPPDLAMGARFSGSVHKVASGGALIALFCTPGGHKNVVGTPQSHPEQWAEFLLYGAGDIEAMRSVFQRTRQLPLAEWKEYWAMERINERGVGIDLAMVTQAAYLAQRDDDNSRAELKRLTVGQVGTVNEVANMTEWLLKRLPRTASDVLIKREAEIDEETGLEKRPAKYALTRKQVQRLIVKNTDPTVDKVLQIRLYGGSKTPAKFARMRDSHVDGILYGQYVFNGAAQTGRASSKGVQVHNLARDTLSYEHEAIEALLAATNYDDFCCVGDDSPVSRKLSLLIRPAFVPRGTKLFVWSDWSQIEARILPWLCDHLGGARERLEIFRQVDRDPSVPDLYTRTAADLSHVDVADVTKAMRQRGKVAELALGFLGGKGALQTMAAGYGLDFDDTEAQEIVNRWRAANPWAGEYGRQLWQAMEIARTLPYQKIPAGRCNVCWLPQMLGGSLVIQLPSRRLLTYRALRYEMVPEKDDDGNTIRTTRELTYARGYGRQKLWPGIFIENVTQATAADFLRGTLVRLEQDFYDWAPVRLHTHDEILTEVDADWAQHAASRLREEMQRGFEWSEGLPLMSEETIAPYYTKRA